jgi:diguanylate cyclase (GGDEF)-like protein
MRIFLYNKNVKWGVTGAILVGIILHSSLISAQSNNAIQLQKELTAADGQERGRILARLTEVFRTDDPQKAIQHGQEALRIFESTPDVSSEVVTLCEMGWAYMELGEYKKAVDHNEKALQLAKTNKDQAGVGRALNNLGVITQRKGQPFDAVDYFNQSLEVRKKLKTQKDIASSLNNLGSVFAIDLDDHDRAIDYYQQALKINQELKDHEATALSLTNLGIVYGLTHDYTKALDYLNKAQELETKYNLKQKLAYTLQHLGEIYSQMGKYEKALQANQQSLEIRNALGEKLAVAGNLNDIGDAYLKLGAVDLAEKKFNEALSLAEQLKDEDSIVENLLSLSKAKRKRGEYQEAESIALKAFKISSPDSSNEAVSKILEELAAAQEGAGNYSAALATHKKFKEVNDSVFKNERSHRLALLESRYELEKRERDVEKLKNERAGVDLQLQRERSQRYLLLVGGIALGIVGYLIRRKREDSARITEELSLTDPITDLHNQRFILQTIGFDLASSLRKYQDAIKAGEPYPRYWDVIFLVIEVDNFKLIKAQYGLSAGDEILKQIGKLLQKGCRATDTIVRWNAEDFLLIARFSNRDDAGIIAERYRSMIESADLTLGEEKMPVTCSIGFAAYPFAQSSPATFSWEQVVAFANGCLTALKRSSPNSWIGLHTNKKSNLQELSTGTYGNLRKWIEQGELTPVSSLKLSAIQWSFGEITQKRKL